jgi:hypothetical protein
MQKHTKRKNVPAIGEIQRKSRDNPAEELHTVGYHKLERRDGLLFLDLPKSGGS